MQMPQVTEEHRKLKALVGSWVGDETIFPSPWDPKGGQASAQVEARLDLDGFFLVVDYEEQRDGRINYRAHAMFGWDARETCYTMHWFDTMGGGGYALPARGRWEGDTLAFEQSTRMGHARYSYRFAPDGTYTFRLDQSQDGSDWKPFVEARYRRA